MGSGRTVVVFEDVYYKNDLTDVGQTVNIPDVATNFPEILGVFQGISRCWKPELENSGYPET